jgi:hypothetical protein
MNLRRRDVLKAVASISVASTCSRFASAEAGFAPRPGRWRRFQVKTTLELADARGGSQAWIPLPAVNEKDWFRSIGNTWTTNGKAAAVREPRYGTDMLHVEWEGGDAPPMIEVISTIATRDRAVDIAGPGNIAPLTAAERALYLSGTDLIPVDGIVAETSDRIVAGASTDIEKARAIYEWVVDNTFRNAATPGLRHR